MRVDSESLVTMNGLAFEALVDSFYSKLMKYFDRVLTIELLIVLSCDITMLLVCLLIWRPYVANLNNSIWRTKGMLSMIPMDVIISNESLRVHMLKGDLMKAVK